MKKRFSIMALALVAAFGFTACHDDDDEDENSATVSNFDGSANIGASMFNSLSSKMGVTACYITDDNQIADLYTFSTMSTEQISEACGTISPDGKTVAFSADGLAVYGEEAWYGGFCPTWFAADDEEQVYLPACRSYNGTHTGALLCNPGTACKTIFTRHMAADLTSAMAAIKKLKVNSLYVCPVEAYNYINDNENTRWEGGYDLTALPANHEIQFVVYGYVNHCNISNIQSAISSLKAAATEVGQGGKMCEKPAVLAKTDGEGKLTVNKDWQKLDLSSIKDCYLLECAIRVVDTTTGKTSKTYVIDGENNEDLNYVLISDIAFTGRSFF